MTIRTIPVAPEDRPCAGISSTISPRALASWDAGLRASVTEDERTIGIYDAIGYDYWTGDGVTAKRVAGALRSMGKGPVTVNVNSPGGDMFEGLAIYNLLREHDGEVTVRVLGLAASAASVIAMAGDQVQIARAAFFMIHNAWIVVAGNRNELRDYAKWLEPFDAAMADIYAVRTGEDAKAIEKLMDGETWIGGSDAVSRGFADDLLASDQVSSGGAASAKAASVRRIESALKASGLSRAEAQRLIADFKSGLSDSAGGGEPGATGRGPRDAAALSETAALAASLTTILNV